MIRVMWTTRRLAVPCVAVLACAVLVACGDSPTNPGPIQQPPPQQQPNNQPPVIESIAVSTQRVEADTDVTVTAVVRV